MIRCYTVPLIVKAATHHARRHIRRAIRRHAVKYVAGGVTTVCVGTPVAVWHFIPPTVSEAFPQPVAVVEPSTLLVMTTAVFLLFLIKRFTK